MKDHARPATPRKAGGPGPFRLQSRPAAAFVDLPEYKQIMATAAAGDQLGMDNPFFREHAGAPGATTVVDGRELINFASYDYLGLNRHAEVLAAGKQAIERYGISASASRLVAGERPVHGELEAKLANFYGVDAALVFVSGYLTNVTTIATLLGSDDLIIHDEFIHNSALTGAKLSGAHRRFFRHNDAEDLENVLRSATGRYRRILVVVEGVYSMDGDVADLRKLIELKARYGFWLMVDEAHALGSHRRDRPRHGRALQVQSARCRHLDGHALQDDGKLRRLHCRQRRADNACSRAMPAALSTVSDSRRRWPPPLGPPSI